MLSLGAVLLFIFGTAAVKHRFGADYRSAYLEDTESKLGIPVLPLRTDKSIEKMKKENKPLTGGFASDQDTGIHNLRGRIYRVIRNQSAELLLIKLIFGASILMIGLAISELLGIFKWIPDIYPLNTNQ